MTKLKKLNCVESLVLSKYRSTHKKEISGPASVIRKAEKIAESEMDLFREVVDHMSAKAFEELTLEEKKQAIEDLLEETVKKQEDIHNLRVALLVEKYNLEKLSK